MLRLWVAMVDYREEMRVGQEILARVVEAYRKIRNTCRILAANLFDFDPANDQVAPSARSKPVDRYILSRYAELALEDARAPTTRSTSSASSTALNAFVTVDLSAFYVDVTKDRLYTLGSAIGEPARGADRDVHDRGRPGAADGADPAGDRRAAVEGAARARARSRCTWPSSPTRRRSTRWSIRDLNADWQRLLLAPQRGQRARSRRQRKEKVFGTSLGAQAGDRRPAATTRRCCGGTQPSLPMLFIVSEVRCSEGAGAVDRASRRSARPA